jgi:predicted membrane-bound spermidine synthase
MSTTTPHSEKTPVQEEAASSAAGHTFQRWLLILLVFVGGMTSLGVELSASRLLAPYFGTSLFVWANLIGLILLYLTVGYYLGGHLADRYPSPTVLYGMTAVAALLISLIPPLSRPILNWSLTAFATFSVSVFISSLVSVILLFAVPMILLGCVSPFAIRLSVDRIGTSGRTAGLLYAISTGGSIVGTFLPVLVLIPTIGTYKTFLLFAGALLLVSIIGLIATRDTGANKNNRNKRVPKRWFSLLLLIPTLATILGMQGPIKPASGTNGGELIAERESPYNYIQVVQSGKETQLVLNEGLGIHSIYNPDQILTRGPWDDFMVAPFFNNVPFTQGQVKRVCIIGLGAGTLAHELTAVYGPIPIDGVEIDSEIVAMGRKYFNMNEPNLNVIVQDGRYFLRSTEQKYDIIGIDAYQQPYIPFQLTTTEFFKEIKEHLTPTGVAIINVGRTTTDFRLVDALAQNIHTVYPSVYIIDNQRFSNSLVFATNDKTQLSNFAQNAGQLTNPLLQQVTLAGLSGGNIREEQQAKVFFTDDIAPVEQLIDLIIFNAAQTGKD